MWASETGGGIVIEMCSATTDGAGFAGRIEGSEVDGMTTGASEFVHEVHDGMLVPIGGRRWLRPESVTVTTDASGWVATVRGVEVEELDVLDDVDGWVVRCADRGQRALRVPEWAARAHRVPGCVLDALRAAEAAGIACSVPEAGAA